MITVQEKDESLLGEIELNVHLSDLQPHALRRRIKQVPESIKQRGQQSRDWFLYKFLEISYIKLHVAYFALFGFIGSLLVFFFEIENTNIDYIDALFMSFSAICVTGLTTVDLSRSRFITKLVLMILMQMGSIVLLTLTTVIIRRYYFRKRFFGGQHVTELNDVDDIDPKEPSLASSSHGLNTDYNEGSNNNNSEPVKTSDVNLVTLSDNAPNPNSFNEDDDVPSSPTLSEDEDEEFRHEPLENDSKPAHITVETIADNGQGKKSDEEERHERRIKVVEYSALSKLMRVVLCYILVTYVVAFAAFAIYTSQNDKARRILKENGDVNPVWFSAFHTISAFNNAGLSLLRENMVPFASDRYMIMITSLIIAMGNIAFPIFLRFIIFALRRASKDSAPYKILLVRPRTLFTHLFPSTETRLLTLTLILITVAQLALFLILDVEHKSLASQSASVRWLTAWFTSVCTKTAGFNSVDIATLQQGMLVLLVVSMYISSYPFVLTLHQSAQIEGNPSVYLDHRDEDAENALRSAVTGVRLKSKSSISATRSLLNAVSFHTQSLFYQHIVWLFFTWFLIAAIEGKKMATNYDIFKILFEIASAYGTVGLSLGWPGAFSSYSTGLRPFSKFLIILVMMLGRHRGLPSSLDPAIQLYQKKRGPNVPSSDLDQQHAEANNQPKYE